MIEIQIAGAGAGKTYGLSERIFECNNLSNSHKLIYAITFTNSAKNKISETIIKKYGYVPEKIKIETVHSFFLNEIIYPYSRYSLSEVFNNAVSHKLPSDFSWKRNKKNKLKERNIIHNEDVFQKAKIIIDRNNSKHSNRLKRERVDLLISHITSKISHIFIDESQDLDLDALKAFEILGLNNIKTYMIGDPKQAIKYPTDFSDFIKECKTKESDLYNILPNNNITKRLPIEVLKISNLFCPSDQEQKIEISKNGKVNYTTTNESDFYQTFEYYKSIGKLIFIEKKQGLYDTHNNSNKIYFPLTLEEKLRELKNFSHLDKDIFIKSLLSELENQLKNYSVFDVLKKFEAKYSLSLETFEYAELRDTLNNSLNDNQSKYIVSSIDAVKGIESDICIFLLNETMYNYLIKNISKDKYHNKIWKKLYVALTRTSNTLIFAIDKSLFPNIQIENIIVELEKLGITKSETGM